MFDSPHQFEPLRLSIDAALRARAQRIVEVSRRLQAGAHPTTLDTLRDRVRSMNSYYSNRIEGQGTHPANIERALAKDYSERPEVARLQRIAVAHIEAERDLEATIRDRHDDSGTPHAIQSRSAAFAIAAHRALYERLAPADRTSPDGDVIEPGRLRAVEVAVGRHVPPTHTAIPAFLERLDHAYAQSRSVEEALLDIAALHHRLVWVHPFADGNGRAARLQSHCALFQVSHGLWSPSRGLARDRDRYYAMLARADQPRQGDLDGRGALSTRGLHDWIDYFLTVCEDQAQFLSRLLDLAGIKRRLQTLIAVLRQTEPTLSDRLALPLYHLVLAGSAARGEFQQMTGMTERTGSRQMAVLLKAGILMSDSRLGPVRLGFPLRHLAILMPELYPEAGAGADPSSDTR